MAIFTRKDIVTVARSWIGTPYRHMQRIKGAGTDCIGLVVGVHNELYPNEPVTDAVIPNYTPWWAEETGIELLASSIGEHDHGIAIKPADALPGDVFVMRMKERGIAKHCGFYSYDGNIIHSYSGHSVLETHLPDSWRRRIKYAFRFSGVVDVEG